MNNHYNNIFLAAVSTLAIFMHSGLAVANTAVAENDLPDQASAAAPRENLFDVLEYRVSGNTVLPAGAIEEAVYPWLGEGKSVNDVEGARTALEKAYHKAGYLTVMVDIPEQDVKNGMVMLNVTEGKVDRLRVTGSRYYSLGRIREQAPSLAEGGIPHFPEVQKDMVVLNRTADKRVTPVMKAGKKFGTVEVDLKVEDNLPLHGSLEVHDRHSVDTERWRVAGMLRYDNLWQRDHSLTLQFQTAPEAPEQEKILSGSYLFRFDESDLMLAVYGVKSKSDVNSNVVVGGFNVLGDSTIVGARVVVPLPSLDNYYHTLSLGADYKDFREDSSFAETDAGTTEISYMPVALQYTGTLQGEKYVSQLGLGINFGIRGLVGDDEEFIAKAGGDTEARANFLVVKPEVKHTWNLPKGFEFWGKVDGQLANAKLISNEQFFVGGVDTVRGYLESEATGDRGWHASLELRGPSWRSGDWLQELRLYGFYDYAAVRVINELDVPRVTLAGTGFGLNLRFLKHWNASMSVARALRDGEDTQDGDDRAHMRFWYEF